MSMVRYGWIRHAKNSDHKVTCQHRGNHEIHFKFGFSYIRTIFQIIRDGRGLGSVAIHFDQSLCCSYPL